MVRTWSGPQMYKPMYFFYQATMFDFNVSCPEKLLEIQPDASACILDGRNYIQKAQPFYLGKRAIRRLQSFLSSFIQTLLPS